MFFVLMCLLLALKALWGSNLPTWPWQPPCSPQLSLGSSIFKVMPLKHKGPESCHEATAGQRPSYGIMVPTGGCTQGAGAAAPPGSCTPQRHHPPPNVPPWLCYSQLNYSIMTSLLSPNSPNYSLEIYYLIW